MGGFKGKSVTIDRVAAEAGVSKTTVSRFLNGKFECMSDGTRERIREVIERLDYHPDKIARSLKSQSSRALGCVIADISSPFSSILLKGISDVCRQNGYQVLFSSVDNQPELERRAVRELIDSRVDGLILNTTGFNDDFLIGLGGRGVPIVLADRAIGKKGILDTVTTENYHITYSCILHLHRNGFETVAFFTQGSERISPRVTRYEAYRSAVGELYGADGREAFYKIDGESPRDCDEKLAAFVERNPGKRLAIFCVNGVTMLRVLQSMQRGGYRISGKLGICGFDDWGWASLVPPGITTITQDSYAVGVRAARLLLKRIEAKRKSAPVYLELPNRLCIRGSTEPALAEKFRI